jgi:peptidoglycan/xylan/chitin deacetylase (PgdA/CDA1 family)
MADPLPDVNSLNENRILNKTQGGSWQKILSVLLSHRLVLVLIPSLFLVLLTISIFLQKTDRRDSMTNQEETLHYQVPTTLPIIEKPGQATPSANPSTVYLDLTSQDIDFLAGHEISSGDPNQKTIALTFDGGATDAAWPQIRDALKKYSIKPTVFLTGNFIKAYPDIIREIYGMDLEIGNHSTSHPDFTHLSSEQIKEEVLGFQREIQKALGFDFQARFFRFPYGARNPQVLKGVANFGLQSVFWSKGGDSGGAANLSSEQVLANLRNNLRPGQIYLQHIGSTQDGQVLDQFLKEVLEKGYQVVPVSEIITKEDQPPSIIEALTRGLNGPFVFKTK